MNSTLKETALAKLPLRRGKVRDIYDLGDQLLLVSTDRISAFDWVLPSGIPDKGRVLTQLSRYWFDQLDVPHHLLSCDVEDFDLPEGVDLALCERVTRHLNHLRVDYALEVSSPGPKYRKEEQ